MQKHEHYGHRARIRDRVKKEGLENFQDYQVLEYALSFVIPYKDTNPLAHRLINRFGSLAGVLEADEELLKEEGISEIESFVPLTGIDEENIMLTLHAKQVSHAKVITKINRITFKDVINQLDLGSIIYPRYITSEAIIAYVRAKQASKDRNIETLYHMFDARVEAIEFVVDENSDATNIPLKDMKLKNNLLIELMEMTKNKLERKIFGKKEGGEDITYETELLENINKYIER